MLSVRPKAADLVFHLYGRSLHPELFEVSASRSIERGGYRAELSLTTSGHLITWRRDGLVLTEVATHAGQPLPQRRRLLSHRVAHERSDSVECRGGTAYHACFQLERIDAEVFWVFQEELAMAGTRRGLMHRFASGGRLNAAAVSWISVETRPRALLVQAFHTFPDDLAVMKTQSLFETP